MNSIHPNSNQPQQPQNTSSRMNPENALSRRVSDVATDVFTGSDASRHINVQNPTLPLKHNPLVFFDASSGITDQPLSLDPA